jgi:predicted permease
VVNLTLMRGVRRAHELVVRAALGAGQRRLRRLLLAENLVLAVAGAVVGVGIALGGVTLLRTFAARYSPRANEIQLDGVVLGFALALSVAIALLLSLVASLPKEGRFAAAMSAGGHRMSGNLHKQRLQRAMVVAQVAVCVMLLAGAGLLTRTMVQLSEVRTGLATEQVLSMDVPLFVVADAFNRQADLAVKGQYEQMQREIRSLPGVVEVGVGSTMPLRTTEIDFDMKVDGKPPAIGEATPRVEVRTATPEYFRAAGIPLLKGRSIATTDRDSSAKVVVVNQTFANRFFPNEDPLGKRIAWTGEILKISPWNGDWRTIVGVVGDTRDGGLDAQPRPVAFMAFAQEVAVFGGLVIRADNAAGLAPQAMRIVHRIAPGTPIENVLTVAQIKDESVAPRRLNALLVSSFGMLAVIIAAVGIAGVLAFSVSARTNEIGIRMSLGADAGRVQRMILREGGSLLVIGLVLGVAGSFAVAGLMRGLLFGVAPRDPATFAGVAVMMAVIGIVACWIPAARAAQIDPAITMRS